MWSYRVGNTFCREFAFEAFIWFKHKSTGQTRLTYAFFSICQDVFPTPKTKTWHQQHSEVRLRRRERDRETERGEHRAARVFIEHATRGKRQSTREKDRARRREGGRERETVGEGPSDMTTNKSQNTNFHLALLEKSTFNCAMVRLNRILHY